MKNTHKSMRIFAGALLAGGVAVGGLGPAAGTAHASDGPYTWCPGQSMDDPAGPDRLGTHYEWDMRVCHTWYRVSYGFGNVYKIVDGVRTLSGSSVWEGENPPDPSVVSCGLFYCPIPPHEDPNFHG